MIILYVILGFFVYFFIGCVVSAFYNEKNISRCSSIELEYGLISLIWPIIVFMWILSAITTLCHFLFIAKK